MENAGRGECGDLERDLIEALNAEPAVPTETCPDPEELVDLIEMAPDHPNAGRLMMHVAYCAYCRREYAFMREAIQEAARELQVLPPRNRAAERAHHSARPDDSREVGVHAPRPAEA